MSTLLFDIGGTSMRMAIGLEGRITDIEKISTPPTTEEAIATLAAYAEGKDVVSACGGIAGTIAGGIIQTSPHLRAWEGIDFALALANGLSVPVQIQNDAELAGIGEAVYGAGKEYALVAYLGIGTGIGGSLVHNGIIAPHSLGFEPGHQVIDVSTGDTFEGLVSGHALKERYNESAHLLSQEVYVENTPILAAGIYNVLLSWSPDILVLGGSLINEENGYKLSAVQEAVQEIAHALPTLPPIVRASLGDSCGLYGALAVSEAR